LQYSLENAIINNINITYNKTMARSIPFTLKFTPNEKKRLQYTAKISGVSMSELIQDFCKQLPKPPEDVSTPTKVCSIPNAVATED
jgi:hypothetical protein